jgi:hypothetical protein
VLALLEFIFFPSLLKQLLLVTAHDDVIIAINNAAIKELMNFFMILSIYNLITLLNGSISQISLFVNDFEAYIIRLVLIH